MEKLKLPFKELLVISSQLFAQLKKTYFHSYFSPFSTQAGFAGQLVMVLLLVAGVGFGTYLTQQRTNLIPRAATTCTQCEAAYQNTVRTCQGIYSCQSVRETLITEAYNKCYSENECAREIGSVNIKACDDGCSKQANSSVVVHPKYSACLNGALNCISVAGEVKNTCTSTCSAGGPAAPAAPAVAPQVTTNSPATAANPVVTGAGCKGTHSVWGNWNGEQLVGDPIVDYGEIPGQCGAGSSSSSATNSKLAKAETSTSVSCNDTNIQSFGSTNRLPSGYEWRKFCDESCDPNLTNQNQCLGGESVSDSNGVNRYCGGFKEGGRCVKAVKVGSAAGSGRSSPSSSPSSSSVSTNPTGGATGSGGSCRSNPVTPPADLKWFAFCNTEKEKQYGFDPNTEKTIFCATNADCPQNNIEIITDASGQAAATGQYFDKTKTNWCFKFDEGNRCLQLRTAGAKDDDFAFDTPLDMFERALSLADSKNKGVMFGGITIGETPDDIAGEIIKSINYHFLNIVNKVKAGFFKTPEAIKVAEKAKKIADDNAKKVAACKAEVNTPESACVIELKKANHTVKADTRLAKYYDIVAGKAPDNCVKADLGTKPRLEAHVLPDSSSEVLTKAARAGILYRLSLCSTKDGKKLQWRVEVKDGVYARTDGKLFKDDKESGTLETTDFSYDKSKIQNKENVEKAEKLAGVSSSTSSSSSKCTVDGDCKSDQYCDKDGSKTCKTKLKKDAKCSRAIECTSGKCTSTKCT